MKKCISVALATFCAVSFVEATTLEEMNKLVGVAKTQTLKQVIICERESNFIYKDPQQCIKAADMLLEVSKKATKSSLLRCELFGLGEEACKLDPEVYQKTDKEFFNEYMANSYAGAGIIYDESALYEKGVTMYKKAIEYDPKDILAQKNLGVRYYFGQGIAMDRYKAYKHMNVAAKQGDQQAQVNLDILCSESPWACK